MSSLLFKGKSKECNALFGFVCNTIHNLLEFLGSAFKKPPSSFSS
jgi:hypothetical protein